MKFLRNLLATILGFWIALILLIFIGIGIVAGISMEDQPEIKNNAILEINFDGVLKDYVSFEQDAFNAVLKVNQEIGLNQILGIIKKAKNDSKIKAISINDIPNGIGWAQLTELRNALESFKQAGWKIQ